MKMGNTLFTVEKHTAEVYQIRHQKNDLWAKIYLVPGHQSGRIIIACSYGAWQNYWGACGCDFKTFLSGLDIHYAAQKFGQGEWFNHEATQQALADAVVKYDGPKEDKRAMFDEIAELEDLLDFSAWQATAYQCKTLHKLWDTGPEVIRGITPSFKAFWNNIWPVFLDEIKKELTTNQTQKP